MNIASFTRFAVTSKIAMMDEHHFALLFFTQCEELNGSSMLGRLSHDYETI
jgi:hypothetical protein